jgi:carbamate kinase
VESGVTVIACGGGGIPVTRGPDDRLRGVEAVIDKDLASALLAERLGATRLVMTTGVDGVYRDFLTDRPELLSQATSAELERLAAAGQFPAGSMGPKIEAALAFLERGGDEVVICRPEALAFAWVGRAGTRIRKDEP